MSNEGTEPLTDEEVREGEELKQKLQKKHKKTAKKLGTLKDSQDFGTSHEITIKRPRRRSKKTEEEGDDASEGGVDKTDEVDSTLLDATGAGDASATAATAALGSTTEPQTDHSVGDAADVSDPAAEATAKQPKMSKTKAALQKKLQSKLEQVKESKKAEEAQLSSTVSAASKRFRSLRDHNVLTRFETEAERERAAELEDTLRARSNYKQALKQAKKQFAIPTEQECIDFFTKTWDDVDAEKSVAGEEAAADQPDKAAVDGAADDVTASDKAPIFLLDEMVVNKRLEYVTNQKRLEYEEEKYFVPTMLTADEGFKVPEGREVRHLGEEGLYVGEKPRISLRNLNRMEHRILKENSVPEKWFGQDGHLVMCANPLKFYPSKPILYTAEDLEPELQTYFVKASCGESDARYIDGRVPSDSSVGRYQLSVEVPQLRFTHHPLFSREHMVASSLQLLCATYSAKLDKNLSTHYAEKIKALHSAISKVDKMLTLTSTGDDNHSAHSEIQIQQLRSRLDEYRRELRSTRKAKEKEDREMRETLTGILRAWKQIKSLRQQTDCVCTPLKLLLQKEDVDKKEDLEEWRSEVEFEVQEAAMFYLAEQQVALSKYKADLEQWEKLQTRMRKLHQRKQKKRAARVDDEEAMVGGGAGAGGAPNENEGDDADLNLPPRPEPPADFDEESIRQQITDKFLKIRRKPGEPKITPILTRTATVTPSAQCPSSERERRNAIKNVRYIIKVLYNGKEVSQTPSCTMNENFVVSFDRTFHVAIVQWPESVVLQILEAGSFSSTEVAQIKLPIPDAAVNTSNVSVDAKTFSSDQVVAMTSAAVGSGKELLLLGDEKVTPFTSGEVSCSIAWALSADGSTLVPADTKKTFSAMSAMKSADPISAIGSSGHLDMPALVEWVKQNQLDPNDPANSTILYHVKMYTDGALGGKNEKPEYFRLEQLQEEFDFCTDDELNSNKRFRLLEYRSQEVPDFRNYRMVPIVEQEIRNDFFDDYERKMAAEESELGMTSRPSEERGAPQRVEEEMDQHRILVNKIRKKVYENVLIRFITAKHQFVTSDIVHEETIPDTSMIGETIKKFFEPRRPLRPERKERKAVAAPNLSGADVKILVNIESATHLPIRKDAKNLQDENYTFLRPFVEVTFQGFRRATGAASSYSPTWNEEIAIPFSPPNNDFSPSNLQTIDENIFINVFDQIKIDLVQDERDRATVIHQRLERRWLGSIKVPFSTIYFNGKIDGTFRLNAPPVMLGYKSSRELENKTVGGGIAEALNAEEKKASEKAGSYLSLFATIEPPLAPAEPVKEQFESREDPELIRYAQSWQTGLEKTFPKRNFACIVVDIHGQSVFVTRYVKPIAPPEQLNKAEGDLTAMERVARFVGNIPFVSDNLAFPGVCDIWSTCDQFLTMLAGDEEEHAVLLCNYFLSMGVRSYLLLGYAIPEGETAYVLSIEGDKVLIWNPSTGVSYKKSDNFCPLLSVGCLIDSENVYANIQPFDEPYRVDFNVKDSSKWRPFFGSKYSLKQPLATVQPATLLYEQTSEDRRQEIQERIERSVRDKLMNWRPRYITRWNRHCQVKFRELLPKLENSRTSTNNEKHQEYLKSLLDQHQISGFPLNMPLTTMQALFDEVESTGVHLAQGSDVEFALAVYLHAYPNSVFSVWIYVACLSRKTSAPPTS